MTTQIKIEELIEKVNNCSTDAFLSIQKGYILTQEQIKQFESYIDTLQAEQRKINSIYSDRITNIIKNNFMPQLYLPLEAVNFDLIKVDSAHKGSLGYTLFKIHINRNVDTKDIEDIELLNSVNHKISSKSTFEEKIRSYEAGLVLSSFSEKSMNPAIINNVKEELKKVYDEERNDNQKREIKISLKLIMNLLKVNLQNNEKTKL